MLALSQACPKSIHNRCLPSDCMEKLSYTTVSFSPEATNRKREEETAAALERYRKNRTKRAVEEWEELRSIFGEGTAVIDIITGEVTRL